MVNFQSRNSRQGGRGSSSRPSPPPKVLTKKEIQQKQQKLTNSLREAETKQLAEYLKNRSSLLDEEIQQTREKLNLNLSSSSSQEPKLSIHPRERERGLRSSKEKSRDDDFTTIENYQKEEYQLKYLLQRLLQCMEDSQMTPSQITSCFLPSQHLKFNKGIISLQDAVEVFQVDLVQPLSKQDQSLLLLGYGTENNDVDIQTLLQDLGYWDPSLPDSPPRYLRGRDDDLDEELPMQFRDSLQRANSPPRNPPSSNDRSRNDLADIHDLVKESLMKEKSKLANGVHEDSDKGEDGDKDEDILSQLRQEMEKEKEQTLANKVKGESTGMEEKKDPTTDTADNNKPIEQLAAENVAKALALENAKLKAELSAFDKEFFDELEDMKLLLSETKPTKSSSSQQGQHTPLSPRTIGRLGRSAKVSLKAMTRLNPTKPLTGQYDMSQTLPGRFQTRNPRPKFAWSLQMAAPRSSPLDNTTTNRDFEPIDLRNSLNESLGKGITSNESFGNLCERRLQFELQNHPDPGRATKTLLHEINTLAHSEQCKGYILPQDLHRILTHIGIAMSLKEVEVLCTGFASNGTGGIDALELGRVIQTMMYNTLNNPLDDDPKTMLDDALQGLLEALAKEIIMNSPYGKDLLPLRNLARRSQKKNNPMNDQTILSKIYSKVEKILFPPFFGLDTDETGVISLKDFLKLLQRFHHHSRLSYDEINLFKECYATSLEDQEGQQGDREREGGRDWIVYSDFVQDLSHVITELLLSDEPLSLIPSDHESFTSSSSSWLLNEFYFVDNLMNQLEEMKPSLRRKILLQLQSTLRHTSDPSSSSIDGYSLLKSLLSVGFHISREIRIQFLQNMEKYSLQSSPSSSSPNYEDLCTILSSCCLPWTSQERFLLKKILSQIGVTCSQRWQWFHRFKRDLFINLQDLQKKLKKKSTSSSFFHYLLVDTPPPGSVEVGEGEEEDMAEGRGGNTLLIPASIFLHCLRENGINLDIDEEALLLDCLDFQYQTTHNTHNTHPSFDDQDPSYPSIPQVSYDSFLTICSHFIGKWYHVAPDIHEKLKSLMIPMSDSSLNSSIKELTVLFKAFDERGTSTIEFRPFLVSCRRSRLLSSFDTTMVEELGKLLVEEGEGRIKYVPFLLHLRALQHELKRIKIQNKIILEGKQVNQQFEISQQLLNNSSDDSTGTGTLKPLREYLIQLQESKTIITSSTASASPYPYSSSSESICLLTNKDITELLREFNVVYNSQDLEEFLDLISTSHSISDYFHATPQHPAGIHWNPNSSFSQLIPPNASSLIHLLQQIRLPWYQRHPRLAQKMKQFLFRLTTDGIWKLITRLRGYSRGINHQYDTSKDTGKDTSDEIFISSDIFQIVLSNCGLNLNDQEISYLCDESDSTPRPSTIRLSILYEALSENNYEKDCVKNRLNDIYDAMKSSPPPTSWTSSGSKHTSATSTRRKVGENNPSSGLFALEHLKSLLWRTGSKLKRRNEEWRSDVFSLLNGFDQGSGVMYTEDLVLALSVLSIRLSDDILLAIPRISPSIDLIPYKQIFEIIFETSLEYDVRQEQLSRYGTTSGTHDDDNHNDDTEGMNSLNHKKNTIQLFINLVRKTLNMFLSQQSDLEQAWSTLLAVFNKFDPNHENIVSPRDFCLAVSVLMDGDSPVFTKQEWQEVIEYFRSEKSISSTIPGVDYIQFLDAVLDSNSNTGKTSNKTPTWMNNSQRNRPRDTLSSSLRKERYRPSTSPTRTSSRSSIGNHTPLSATHGTQSRFRASSNLTNPSSRSTSSISKDPYKKTVTYAPLDHSPSLRSNYFPETDDEYQNSSTISGRGVVGASWTNKSRINQLTKTGIPRTSSKFDEMFGSFPFPSTMSKSQLSSSSRASSTLPSETLTPSQLKFLSNFDTFTIKEFNSELYDCLTIKLGLQDDNNGVDAVGSNGLTRKKLLLKYLDLEDKNHSGTLTKHSFLAGLNALGMTHAFWSKPLQKELINKLQEIGNGMIVIQDVLKLILFK